MQNSMPNSMPNTNEEDLATYYENLINQISQNKLTKFWVFCDSKEFDPIKRSTDEKDKMKKYIKNKSDLWNQKIAGIGLLDTVSAKKINKKNDDDVVFTVKIYIYMINDKGEFDYDDINTWCLIVRYTKAELNEKRPTYDKLIANVKQMVKLAEKKKMMTDFVGITYTEFIDSYNKMKVKALSKM